MEPLRCAPQASPSAGSPDHPSLYRRERSVRVCRAQCGPTADMVLTEAVEPRPTDAYGKSKLAAERGLAELDEVASVAPCCL